MTGDHAKVASLVKSAVWHFPLDLCDIVAGEGAEDASPLRGAHEPTIVAFLHNEHNIAYKTIQKTRVQFAENKCSEVPKKS